MRLSIGDGLKPQKDQLVLTQKKLPTTISLFFFIKLLHYSSLAILDPQGIFGASRNEVSLSIFAFLFAEVVEHLDFEKTVQLTLENGESHHETKKGVVPSDYHLVAFEGEAR